MSLPFTQSWAEPMKTAKFWVGVVVLASAPIPLPAPYASAVVVPVLFTMIFGVGQRLVQLHDRIFQLEEQLRLRPDTR